MSNNHIPPPNGIWCPCSFCPHHTDQTPQPQYPCGYFFNGYYYQPLLVRPVGVTPYTCAQPPHQLWPAVANAGVVSDATYDATANGLVYYMMGFGTPVMAAEQNNYVYDMGNAGASYAGNPPQHTMDQDGKQYDFPPEGESNGSGEPPLTEAEAATVSVPGKRGNSYRTEQGYIVEEPSESDTPEDSPQ